MNDETRESGFSHKITKSLDNYRASFSMLDNVPRDNVGLIVSPRRSTEGARGSWVKRAVPRQDLRDTISSALGRNRAHRGLYAGSRDKVLIMFLTSKPLARNLIIRPWLRLGPRGISRVDIMIR